MSTDLPIPVTGPDPAAATIPVAHWQPRRALANWLAEYNPFYFLSACCMLLGIFVLNDSLDWSPLPQDNLLILIITLNVYELALVTLAVVLLRRGLLRDGTFLLLLEAFFLADAGFLNMEIFTANFVTGLIVNAVLYGLAVVKVAFIFAAIGLPIVGGLFFFVLAQLALLLAIPGTFAAVALTRAGNLPAPAIYAAWWAAGFVPVLYVLLVRMRVLDGLPRRVAKVFVALPFVSLLGHLCMSSWVHDVAFHASNLSPLLLGLAVWVGRYDWHVSTLAWRMRMHLALPFVAVALSAMAFRGKMPPAPMAWDVLGLPITPLRLALLAASVVYADGWLLHRHAYFAIASGLCFCGAGLGPSVRGMGNNTGDFVRFMFRKLGDLIPTRASQWGVISVVGAFVLLAMGAAVSLLKERPRQDERVNEM